MVIRKLCMASLMLGVVLVASCSSDKTTPAALGGGVGAKCTADSQCTGYSKAACVTEVKPLENLVTSTDPKYDVFRNLTLPFPGGYCSTTLDNPCTADADCGADGQCFLAFEGVPQSTIDGLAALNLPFDISKFAKIGICLKPCGGNDAGASPDCREDEGYKCLEPLQGFMKVINPGYAATRAKVGGSSRFCVQYVDVSALLAPAPAGDAGP